MRVAIVHDYLTQAGGAERVVEMLHQLYPDAPIYTSLYFPEDTLPVFRGLDIRTTFLQRLPFARYMQKSYLPLYPIAFEHIDLTGYDVVLSSTSSFAKGVITGPQTCHICYCHTPARFAWRYHDYIAQGEYKRLMRYLLPFIVHPLRGWDYSSAQRVDHFIANSQNIARRILKFYRRDSKVLHPPVDTKRFILKEHPRGDFMLVVSRLVGYKRVDLAIEACNRLGLPLKIVGSGPALARLKTIAGPTIEFLGRVPDATVSDLLSECRAFVFPGEEDFGIAPLEAMASGRPVVAFRGGGALETVIEGETGLFFDEPTGDSLAEALRRLDTVRFDPLRIRRHAETFDNTVFIRRLREMVTTLYGEHCTRFGIEMASPLSEKEPLHRFQTQTPEDRIVSLSPSVRR